MNHLAIANQPVTPQSPSQHTPSESSGHTSPRDAPPPPTLSPRNRPLPRQEAVRQGLDRRGYRGYARSQREQHEQNRREDEAARLRGLGFAHRERASAYAANAIQLQRAGDHQLAQQWHDAANIEMQWASYREDEADAVLAGTLAPERVDIQSDADFHRINDDVGNLADGGVQTGNISALTGTGHPPSIDTTRRYGERGGLRRPLALHQTDLERHMPRDENGKVVRTADPREGRWFRLANDGGSRADPTRSINCLDCSLSFFDTWVHGRPRVSAPRTFDGYAAGNVSYPIDGEADGPGRVEDMTGGRFQQLCPDVRHLQPAAAQQVVHSAYAGLQNQLLAGGHGSYAFIVNTWEGGASHASVAVNQNGTVLYLDPQSGRISENTPLYAHSGVADDGNVASFDALVLDGNADPMPLAGRPQGVFSARPPITAPPVTPSPPPDPVPAHTDDAPYVNKLYLLDGPTVTTTPDPTAAPAPAGSSPGSSPPPVDPREAEHEILASLDAEHRVALERAVTQARAVADEVLQDLSAVVDTIAETVDGDRPTLVDTEYRAKELSSLARKFSTEHAAAGTEPELFLANANDLVRFSVTTGRDAYGSTVQTILNGLEAQGYQLEDVKNFWRPGNRHNGVNVTMRTPGGHLMEIQFSTEASRSLGKKTHSLYEIVRLESAPASQRIDAFLEILKLNRDAGIADAIPEDLGALPEPKDTSFEKWAQRSGHVWMAYQRDLSAEGRTFAEVVTERGLTIDDFPRGERLGLGDETGRVRLSRSVPTAGDTTDGTDRGAGVERTAAGRDLERAEAEVDVQPDDRSPVDLRRPVRGSTAAGNPSGSRADRPGALGDGVAERGRPVPDVPGGRTGPELNLSPSDGDVPSTRPGTEPTVPPPEMLRDSTAGELRDLGIGLATFADLGLDPDTLPPDERARYEAALRRTALVSPERIRFTQRSVSPATSDGITAQDLVDNMGDSGWRGAPVHGVRWGDGSLCSLDNRRLRAAREAGLGVVPFVVHNPSDRLSDWPHEWSPERQRKNALGVDIMQLADGRWVVGGDEGRVVYAKGTVPQTFGEIALFRAAEQRSLLPGHLFGADREPVLLSKPPAPNRAVELTDAEQRVLDDLRLKAHAVADQVQADLADIGRAVTAELGLSEPIELRGEEHRIKSAESLARKYDDEARANGISAADFAEQVNDVLRFSLSMPAGMRYRVALERVFAELHSRGYEVDPESIKNFWNAGNRFYGFNCTITSPRGQTLKLQLPTEASWRTGKLTHDFYEVLRRDDELAPRRVHAFLRMMQINKRLEIDAAIPTDLNAAFVSKDATFARWILKNGRVWRQYKAWLDLNGRSFAEIAYEFGLTATDFPVSKQVAAKLGEPDVHLLLDLQDGHQDGALRDLRNG